MQASHALDVELYIGVSLLHLVVGFVTFVYGSVIFVFGLVLLVYGFVIFGVTLDTLPFSHTFSYLFQIGNYCGQETHVLLSYWKIGVV